MSKRVFISYRREDTSGYARALYNSLRERLGPEAIFMDVTAIEPGVDFERAIHEAVASCDVLLAVIGRRWLRSTAREGADYVRVEVAAALDRGIRVVPVLVDGATMPRQAELPSELSELSRRNALMLSHERFDADLEALVHAISGRDSKQRHRRPGAATLVGLAFIFVSLLIGDPQGSLEFAHVAFLL